MAKEPKAYRLTAQLPGQQMQTVERVSDGAFIPFDPANKDFQEYLSWLAQENEPDPAPQQATGAEQHGKASE